MAKAEFRKPLARHRVPVKRVLNEARHVNVVALPSAYRPPPAATSPSPGTRPTVPTTLPTVRSTG